MTNHGLSICPWPGDKRWVYSITFDEALSDLHRYTIPILEECNVPGHLEVVVGQMGQIRNICQSSFNGFKHMGPEELREMLARGWGVGNHSWSHIVINAANADQEVGQAKEVLEEAIGEPVTIYCAPGNNSNMNEDALGACRRYGYLGAMGIFDALNRPDDEDRLWMNRTFLHEQGPMTHDSEFDPFRKIQHARRDRGWIIDYLHCPLEKPVHPRKDCSAAQLRERIETVVTEGGDEVWLARVEDATDYRYTRQHAEVEATGEDEFTLSTPNLPSSVQRRTVTLELPTGIRHVEVDGQSQQPQIQEDQVLLDVDLSQGRRLRLVR